MEIVAGYPPPSRTSIPSFPQIIYDRIIDSVGQTLDHPVPELCDTRRTIRTLYACSLTCRSWRQRSQQYLYGHIFLDRDASNDALVNIVRAQPSFGKLIHHLYISFENSTFEAPYVHWPCLVRKLTGTVVQSLYFHGRGEPRLENQFDIGGRTHETFLSFSSSLRAIETLTLSQIRFGSSKDIIKLLSVLPRLQNLYVRDIQVMDDSQISSITTRKTVPNIIHMHLVARVQLRRHIYTSPLLAIVRWVVRTKAGKSLKLLVIQDRVHRWSKDLHGYVTQLLRLAGLTLESVNISINGLYAIHFYNNFNLTELSLSLLSVDRCADTLAAVVPTRLRTLHLSIDETYRLSQDEAMLSEWESLDLALATLRSRSTFRCHIRVRIPRHWLWNTPINGHLANDLPLLLQFDDVQSRPEQDISGIIVVGVSRDEVQVRRGRYAIDYEEVRRLLPRSYITRVSQIDLDVTRW